jgi:hypothetical protein
MKYYEKFQGSVTGTPAPGLTVSINTPLAVSQRPLNETKIREYISKHQGINWDLFGYVKAMCFSSGKTVIYDGQHRIEIVKLICPHIEEVPAHIVQGTPELAAKYFWEENGGSKSNLSTSEQFWAKVQAKDEFALEIAKTISKTNFAVGKVNSVHANRQAKYANIVKAISFSEPAFLRSCQIIDEVFPDGPADNLLSGLSFLLSIPEYAELGNPKKAIGRHFVQWLHQLKAVGANPKNLEFKKYRNNGPWYNAVAYGLARHFFQARRSQGKQCPGIEIIHDIWNKPVEEADDFDSLVF